MSTSLEGIYPPLSSEQEAKVGAFLEATKTVQVPPSFKDWLMHHPTLFAVKWLVSRKWDVKAAVTMYQDAAAWRIAEGMETKPLFPTCLVVRGYDLDDLAAHHSGGVRPTDQFIDKATAATSPYYAAAWHKWDKQGHPVYIERTGKIKTRALVQKLQTLTAPGEPIEPWVVEPHKHFIEVGAQLLRAQQRKGPFVCQATVIMDCAGMSLSQLYGPAMELMKANSTMDQKYSPDGMYRCYVVNCPAYVKVAWAVVKLWIDVESQRKVQFFSPGEPSRAALLEAFDAEHLPRFLGGSCDCDGGCVPDVDETVADGDDGTPQTEEFTVRAMSQREYEVATVKGTKVQWQFTVQSNDIAFSVSFLSSEEGAKPMDLVPPTRVTKSAAPESCTIEAPSDGMFLLRFDNSYSWVSSKVIRLRVTVVAEEAAS